TTLATSGFSWGLPLGGIMTLHRDVEIRRQLRNQSRQYDTGLGDIAPAKAWAEWFPRLKRKRGPPARLALRYSLKRRIRAATALSLALPWTGHSSWSVSR